MSYENCGSPDQIHNLDSEFENSAANLNKLLDQALNRTRTESQPSERRTDEATTVRSLRFYSENRIKLFPAQIDDLSSKITSVPFIGVEEIDKGIKAQILICK